MLWFDPGMLMVESSKVIVKVSCTTCNMKLFMLPSLGICIPIYPAGDIQCCQLQQDQESIQGRNDPTCQVYI